MVAYTSAAAIAAYLAVTFTPEQAAQADVAAQAITTWIDHRTGRTWQAVNGTVSDEIHEIIGGSVYLEYPPVVAVSAVDYRTRQGNQTSDWVPLDASQYQLVDPSSGRVDITSITLFANREDARVDYTSLVTAPPADVAYAATVLAADILSPTLNPDLAGVESLSVGQNDITLRFGASSAATDTGGGSWSAVRVIDAYRRVVLA